MNNKYENLNGLRAYACVGIVFMHVLANGDYKINGPIFEYFIPSFTNFTYLFMLISSFSMCCGYYKKFNDNSISLESFYKRRYQRIWPFFAILCTIELVIDHSMTSLFEWFADLTLAFGLIPNHGIEIVGVGWFLGTVFLFYMIFPFFVFLMNTSQRAWLVMGITIILHYLCNVRFTNAIGRSNLIYSSIFFVAGGIIYLYKDKLPILKGYILVMLIIAVVACYYVGSSDYYLLVLFSLITTACIVSKGELAKILFQNKIVLFLSDISLEIYLCHMFVYRTIEKLNLLHISNIEIANYVLAIIVTICGSVTIALLSKKYIYTVIYRMQRIN